MLAFELIEFHYECIDIDAANILPSRGTRKAAMASGLARKVGMSSASASSIAATYKAGTNKRIYEDEDEEF